MKMTEEGGGASGSVLNSIQKRLPQGSRSETPTGNLSRRSQNGGHGAKFRRAPPCLPRGEMTANGRQQPLASSRMCCHNRGTSASMQAGTRPPHAAPRQREIRGSSGSAARPGPSRLDYSRLHYSSWGHERLPKPFNQD